MYAGGYLLLLFYSSCIYQLGIIVTVVLLLLVGALNGRVSKPSFFYKLPHFRLWLLASVQTAVRPSCLTAPSYNDAELALRNGTCNRFSRR